LKAEKRGSVKAEETDRSVREVAAVEVKEEAKNGSFCRNCGVSGPVKTARCFPDDPKSDKEHRFRTPGEVDDEEQDKPKKKVRLFWKVILTLVLLGAYAIAVVYIVIPIQKYLNQPVATSVTVLNAKIGKPIPFPAIQVCNFNQRQPITEFAAFITDPRRNLTLEVYNFSVTAIVPTTPTVDGGDDYDYDFEFDCFELNNFHDADSNPLQISSKRQIITIVVKLPPIYGIPRRNDYCPYDLCDPDLDANVTLYDIDPGNDAMGVSIAAFTPTGKPQDKVADDVTYISAGAFTRVALTFLRENKLEPNEHTEDSYSLRTSNVQYPPDTWALEFFDGVSFEMDKVVFAEINFGELAYTEVNQTYPYEAFNAFGDATAIMGFFTGFSFFGGPTFLPMLMDAAKRPCWSCLFFE